MWKGLEHFDAEQNLKVHKGVQVGGISERFVGLSSGINSKKLPGQDMPRQDMCRELPAPRKSITPISPSFFPSLFNLIFHHFHQPTHPDTPTPHKHYKIQKLKYDKEKSNMPSE